MYDSVKKDDTSLEVDTADTATSSDKDLEDTPSEVESENQQRQLVIDSDDDESTGLIEPPAVANDKSKNEPPASLKQPSISNATPLTKTIQVSSAALAALEEARKEAELMMASPAKKSKSKKKKKSKKKDKKKN